MRKILVVDDQDLILRILRVVLSKCGVELIEKNDGNGAIEFFEENDAPDVVILDYSMPGMDGVETLKKIRMMPNGKNVPVVMLTARDQTAIRNAAADLGVKAFLTKPFSPVELQKLIREIIPEEGG
ncbi:MAG: response regulator [Chthoniobacterales bacterium]|nr:response regulator [Chthoniobacterales bacterium]MCX7713709.1 response regulator [Chthoniobacterales bacterium]